MKKCALLLILALLFSVSGCRLKDSGTQAAASDSPSQAEPSEAATPSAEPSPSEEGPPETTFSHFLNPGVTELPSDQSESPAGPGSGPNDVAPRESDGGYLSSEDDDVFDDSTALRADFDGNGSKDVLDATFNFDYPPSDEMNYPVKITMSIGGSAAEYENTWNDGVFMTVADFDTTDKYLDIYIIAMGTDVSARVATFRYDGKTLYEYLNFDIAADTAFQYDTQGHIYYLGEYDGNFGVKLYIDYPTGDIYTID
jgi:hypothetical protein